MSALEAEHGKKKAKKILKDRTDALARSLAVEVVGALRSIVSVEHELASYVKTITPEGGYINFYYDTARLASALLDSILACRAKPFTGFSS